SFMGGEQSANAGADGIFRVDGIPSGSYIAGALFLPTSPTEYYGETTRFEVGSSDVDGVEIRAHKGGVVSGTVVLPGGSGTASSGLPQALMFTRTADPKSNISGFPFSTAQVMADGSFEARGLPPGKVSITLGIGASSTQAISGIEINGALQSGPFGLAAGQQL